MKSWWEKDEGRGINVCPSLRLGRLAGENGGVVGSASQRQRSWKRDEVLVTSDYEDN